MRISILVLLAFALSVGAASADSPAKPKPVVAPVVATEEPVENFLLTIDREAQRHGYKVVIQDMGLVETLETIVEKAVPLDRMKKVAVPITDDDEDLVAVQLLGKGEALFRGEDSDVRVWLRKYRGELYQGTPITSLQLPAVVVRGAKQYKTAIGGSAQAFVVEPAW